MATVRIVARRDKRDDRGTIPLYVRITHNRKPRYASLDLRIHHRHWNEKKNRIRGTHSEADSINKFLLQVEQKTEGIIANVRAQGLVVTADRVRDRLTDYLQGTDTSGDDFFAYADNHVLMLIERNQHATAEVRSGALKKLRHYVKKKRRSTLPFEAMTVATLQGYKTHLIKHFGNSTNTVAKSMAAIRAILYQAIREGHFPQEKNPFFQIKLKTTKVRKKKLTIDEIRRIEALKLPTGSLIDLVRDGFMFAFYTGGMRFSDVATAKPKHVRDGRISYKMKKTDSASAITIIPEAQVILDKYSGRKKRKWLFPILEGQRTNGPKELHSSIGTMNAVFNKYLKTIQTMAQIETRITFHLSRHSIAHYLRTEKGWSIYEISELLAHSSIKETETYLKGFDSEDLDQKMREAF